ncbi:DUF3383 family protein [Pseudomonas vancouverensis]|uniref:DUF3383 family protein n=1 Tax=Pseudomonas vancouverensis TaxID=95300 RepID=A0A1H2MUW6_PSEVA|nr:DUF3383 family protein [Pseudomonas vancouverensis]KAB0489692.1 DUF3383 domain-containing protein [Pseudomonas vancouverensis]TDB67188.1 DUF3383 family protein [Pseudomonas vancouverensis]SDU97019.1 Protein of unknown function [Pseudomonas vancouverensis]
MSYPASEIIRINARISPAGLGTANFASAMLFAPETELPEGFDPDTYRTYSTLVALSTDFADTTETYKAAQRWLGGTPATRQIQVWGTATADATRAATLNKARNMLWWYWTMWTADVLAVKLDVLAIASWCDENTSMFIDNQTGANVAEIRDPAEDEDIASGLTALGFRHAYTAAHATDAYSGSALAKHFAAVNYSADRSTITGEFKKSPGVLAESLTGTAYAAMQSDTKKAVFYTIVDNQGSTDSGRWLNTLTHSFYGEFIDDVVNLDACINFLTTSLYGAVANQTTKLAQTPVGQAVLIGAARATMQQFISNGYLGPRNYIDPDDGLEKYTAGFEILTKPEDILDLSDADRDARKSAPLRIRLFRAGAIHVVDVDLDVY